MTTIGILHPGDMGSVVGACAVAAPAPSPMAIASRALPSNRAAARLASRPER